jgi:predicted RNA binding protein YcfA (HicA-like mRNA interferase family)
VTRLPALSSKNVMRALERGGFILVRTGGSHYFYRHRVDPTRQTVVPFHRKDLPPGTLRAILKQARLTPEEFLNLLP